MVDSPVSSMKTSRRRTRRGGASGHPDGSAPVHVRTFLNVQPRLPSQALKALRPMRTDTSTARRSTISSSVMSLRASINPTMKASCASRLEARRQPWGRGVRSPSLARAIQRIALDIPTPNRAAACRADIPPSEAFKTRDRRSSLSALAIIHLIKVDVESAQQARVTSQSIHQSMDVL
ncbi:hypothetical protein MPL3356_10047 [Mesorhizobium plurifarium]|uniref:Uncharacterized protein n=1 Tax=Mesorhizobium plurifarium TaxID=69974 RepID=A0A090DDL4_MESPL|nr:hypothetical protein MPL3356_10047 [Mesorhizobium plurifarium]